MPQQGGGFFVTEQEDEVAPARHIRDKERADPGHPRIEIRCSRRIELRRQCQHRQLKQPLRPGEPLQPRVSVQCWVGGRRPET